jgi:non-ribosomal peptide synthetase component E (peptide arylation enzyme)
MAAALTTLHDRYSDEEISGFYSAGYWQSTTFNQLVAEQAARQPDAVYVFDSTTSLTYSEFGQRALRMAVGFKRSGLARGDRVAVQLPNWAEFPLIAAALSRIGAILVPIMPIYRDDEVAYVLGHSEARAVVCCGEFRGFDHLAMMTRLRASAPGIEAVYVARLDSASTAEASSLDSLIVDGDLSDLAAEAGDDSSPDDGFMIVYTSGTTSRPKGCFHTFNTLRASSAAIADAIGYTDQDAQFGPSPVTHSTGMVTSVVLPLLLGGRSFLMEAWDPAQALDLIERHRLTVAVTATAFLQMLMSAYKPGKHDASSLRVWICAGSPIPGSIIESSRSMFPNCQTLSLYGRSENFLTTMCSINDPVERSATSDGRALAGGSVKVVDPEGKEVARGEEGDLAYKGPSHMIEYFRNESETAALFTPDGFSRSGDLGRMDGDGFVRVTGRLKDIVIRGGMNISATEVEEHVLTHPRVAQVSVVGMPDDRLGEKVCAYVVASDDGPPLTLAELTDHLRAQGMATQKLPERLVVVGELPMTATGKVQKHVLRSDIAGRLL